MLFVGQGSLVFGWICIGVACWSWSTCRSLHKHPLWALMHADIYCGSFKTYLLEKWRSKDSSPGWNNVNLKFSASFQYRTFNCMFLGWLTPPRMARNVFNCLCTKKSFNTKHWFSRVFSQFKHTYYEKPGSRYNTDWTNVSSAQCSAIIPLHPLWISRTGSVLPLSCSLWL